MGNGEWLNDWREEYRPCLRLLAQEHSLTLLQKRCDLSGGGGAHTYLVSAEGQHGPTNPLILKCGPKEVIEEDLSGHEEASIYFFGGLQKLGQPVECDGYECFLMKLVGRGAGQTFHDFFQRSTDSKEIEGIVRALFEDVLQPKKHMEPTVNSVFALHKFHDPEVMRQELRFIGDPPFTLIDWWLRASYICQKRTIGLGSQSWQTLAHGDLHARNIIIDNNGNPSVIDFGLTGDWHVMRDMAKLEREVLLFLNSGIRFDSFSLRSQALPKYSSLDAQKKTAAMVQELREQAKGLLSQGEDWEYEYYGALLAQFIFAAGNSALNEFTRKKALEYANELRNRLEVKDPALKPSSEKQRLKRREDFLWRLSYAFLRLDQLPSGGWSKTLPEWLEALWEGDDGRIPRHPQTRINGGTDLTGYAFYHYLKFQDPDFIHRKIQKGILNNDVLDRVLKNLRDKIGYNGGIEVTYTWTDKPAKKIRHTLMGQLIFLLICKVKNVFLCEELDKSTKYLLDTLSDWKEDKSHLFGMFAVLVKLSEIIEHHFRNHDQDKLLASLQTYGPKMERDLLAMSQNISYRPINTAPLGHHSRSFFRPYYDFWRMERSNFLMYFPFLVSEDGHNMLVKGHNLRIHCADCLDELLSEIKIPFTTDQPSHALIKYHVGETAPRDWGLSAELAAILELPAARNLLIDFKNWTKAQVDEKRKALRIALLHTFDMYYTQGEIFKFTHGVSFGRYLQLTASNSIRRKELNDLDAEISKLCHTGVTENAIYNLLNSFLQTAQARDKDDVNLNSVKDLLVAKLESGEYTPDKELCPEDRWRHLIDKVVNSTSKTFYDQMGGEIYTEYYGSRPIKSFVDRLEEFMDLGKDGVNGKKALDVGCGPGQYAELLVEKGFEVELADISKNMLKKASERLDITTPNPVDIYELSQKFSEETFDLIFACAMMVHVPLDRAKDVCRSFYRLLKSGGILFVNVKLRDHTLISKDGRFYSYYRDHLIPMSMLKETGFSIEELTLRWNRKNLYGDPKEIHWANFYCKKPD